MKQIYKLLALAMFFSFTLLKGQPVIGTTSFFTNTTTALNPNTACSVTKTTSVSGWLFSVQSTSNCGFNWTNSTGGDGRIQYLVGFGTLTQGTFGSNDGSNFAMNNMVIGVSTSSWVSKPMTYVGYSNGLPVPGATLNAMTPASTGILNTVTINFSSITAFNNVDEIRMAPNSTTCNTIYFIEEITIGTASCSTGPTLSVAGSTNVSCNGAANGAASISASGAGPFTYAWSPSGGSGATANALSAGVYTCVVTNSCSLSSAQTVTITQPSALVTSTAVTNVACNGGSNGVAAISASGGTGTKTYLWSNGGTTSVITGLMAGVYTATVTDANGCKSIKSAVVTQPSAIVTTTAVTNVACNGGSNGVAAITASGGAGGYSYLWSNGPSTSVITGLLAGVYTATITDANSCTSIKSAIVTQPTALVTTTAVTNVACNGGTGSATITASGGTGTKTYLWSNGATTSAISGVFAGVYTATVTDANSCTSIKSVNITQPAAIVTNTAVTNAACNNTTGSATVTTSGGATPYTYLWSSSATTSVATNLFAGIYTITVTDANNCTSIKSVNITAPAALLANATAGLILCNGGNTTVTVTATGGTPSYTGTGTYTATAGVFNYTITDANNCSASASVNISQPAALTASIAASTILCNGGVSNVTVSAAGGTPSYSGIGTSTMLAGSNTYTVSDANGCSLTVSVSVNQPAAIVLSQTTSVCSGQSFTVGASTYTATGIYTNTLTSVNGCDSIVTTALTVHSPVNALVTLNGLSIAANNTVASSYQWIDCNNNNQAIAGATVSVFTATSNGSYAVIVTENGCTATSSCVSILSTGVKANDPGVMVSVSPNPSNGIFTIDLPVTANVEIMDALGRIVFTQQLNAGKQYISLSSENKGIYFLKLSVNGKQHIKKIVIDK